LRELPRLEREQKKVAQRHALATAVVQRASQNHYSVALLFLEPQEQAGCMTIVEGVARRAVKIVIPSDHLPAAANPAYYELEVFTADSQNLPVVCCVPRLPANFPRGDTIREPVRIAGVFFKSWLYRTRQAKDHNKVSRQQRLSAPIVIGAEIERLTAPSIETKGSIETWGSTQAGWWPLVAGIGFLVLMVAYWASAILHARRDREHIRTSRLSATGLPPQWLDTHEDRSPR
jgi:hypothetical protein